MPEPTVDTKVTSDGELPSTGDLPIKDGISAPADEVLKSLFGEEAPAKPDKPADAPNPDIEKAADDKDPQKEPEAPKPEDKQEFMPGKYKTIEDFAISQEKRAGSIAAEFDKLRKDITTQLATVTEALKTLPSPTKEEVKAQEEPDAEALDDLNSMILEGKGAEAIAKWFKQYGTKELKSVMENLVTEAVKNAKTDIVTETATASDKRTVWNEFVKANPEIQDKADAAKADPEIVGLMQQIFEAYPRINNSKSGLYDGLQIALSEGKDIDEKYENWVVNKKSKKGDPTKPKLPDKPLPGPGSGAAPNRGGGGTPDAFTKALGGLL